MSLVKLLLSGAFLAVPYWLVAQTDYSMHFDGIDDRIVVGDSTAFKIDDQATIEFWLNVEELGNDLMLLVSKEGEYNIGLSKEGTISWAFANTIPGWNWFYSSTTLPLNTWVHVAVRFDLDYIDIFLNGAKISNIESSGSVGDVDPANNQLIIGDRQQDVFNLPFKGKMDEFRLWDIARSDVQIQDKMMSKLQGDESGLVVYYRFDEVDKPCDVVNGTENDYHGQRFGENGPNLLPQYDQDVPFLLDADQVAKNDCLFSSIDPAEPTAGWEIYPNPANDQLHITLDNQIYQPGNFAYVSIMDVQGRVVMEWPVNGPKVSLPLSSLVNGIYTLYFAHMPAQGTARFVVNH